MASLFLRRPLGLLLNGWRAQARAFAKKKGEASEAPRISAEELARLQEEKVNYGSFDIGMLLEDEEEEVEQEENPQTLTEVLRPDSILHTGRNKTATELFTAARGYSYDQLDALADPFRLETVNFFHLTMPEIEHSTDLLKPLITPWKAPSEDHIFRITTRRVYQGIRDSKPHPLEWKVTLKVYVRDLKLTDSARSKLIALVQSRYHPKTDELVLNSNRFPSADANRVYLFKLMQNLVEESKKATD